MPGPLCLDLGLSTGYAHPAALHGVWNLRASGSEHAGRRLQRLEDKLRIVHRDFGVSRVVYEESHQNRRGLQAIKLHCEFVGIVIKFAAEIGVPYRGVGVSTIKAFAGSGRYKKPDMIRAAKIKLGIEITSDDEADAVWLLAWVAAGEPMGEGHKPKKVERRRKKADPQLF